MVVTLLLSIFTRLTWKTATWQMLRPFRRRSSSDFLLHPCPLPPLSCLPSSAPETSDITDQQADITRTSMCLIFFFRAIRWNILTKVWVLLSWRNQPPEGALDPLASLSWGGHSSSFLYHPCGLFTFPFLALCRLDQHGLVWSGLLARSV